MRVCYFGTYDLDQPRTRVILEGLRKNDVDIVQYHVDLWSGTSQKIKIARQPFLILKELRRFIRVYYSLFSQLRLLQTCDVVVYGHLGQIDILLTAWWFRCQGIPVVWDALISLFETVTYDRAILSSHSIWAWLLRKIDKFSGLCSSAILTDTRQNGRYWQDRFAFNSSKIHVVPVGAEEIFYRAQSNHILTPADKSINVLFYGKYAPLHGIKTIVDSAYLLKENSRITWTLIGKGQQRDQIEEYVKAFDLKNVVFVDWIRYVDLPARISCADIGLGIFGSTNKARRVFPNKGYQILASGCPLITADTPAAREILYRDGLIGGRLVAADNAQELANAVIDLSESSANIRKLAHAGSELHCRYYSSEVIGQQVASILYNLL
jgi:glycosyltransferase involved in cell wall biosynthesis